MRENEFPNLFGAGEFDSRQKFHNMETSHLRKVVCYEFEYYSRDGGYMEINGVLYPRRNGNILIARPGDLRRSTLPFRTHYFYLSNVSGTLKQVLHSLPPVIQSNDRNADLKTFLRIINLFLSASPSHELAAMGEILLFVDRLTQLKAATTYDTEDAAVDNILTTAQHIIDLRYFEDLSVEKIAEECHISVSYLHKLFTEILHESPHMMLVNRRITEARTLLTQTDLPVGEIALRCGFHSHSYFNDCFRERVGVTPGAFRKAALYSP